MHLIEKIPKVKLEKSNIKLVNYGGLSITNILEFLTVEIEYYSPVISGLSHCEKFILIKRVVNVQTESIVLNYKNVFQGRGCYKQNHQL